MMMPNRLDIPNIVQIPEATVRSCYLHIGNTGTLDQATEHGVGGRERRGAHGSQIVRYAEGIWVGLLNCAKVDRILLHPAMWSMIWNGDTEIANLILMGAGALHRAGKMKEWRVSIRNIVTRRISDTDVRVTGSPP